MDAISTYGVGNLVWLSAQALPLILWPSFVSSLLGPEGHRATDVETYFARALGLAVLALALTVVFLSGALPLASKPGDSSSSSSSSSEQQPSPYAAAAVAVSGLHHASAAFHCYARHAATLSTGFLLGSAGSGVMAALALYCVLFAGDPAMTSRYHKFDQGTSGFPFKNSQSYRAKKKAL